MATPARSTCAIEAEGLTRRFGNVLAVDRLDLRVEAGTLLGFLGPNGAGKSTTLRLLTGLLAPSSGRARVLGLPVGLDEIEFRRHVGVVPEDLALFDRLSVREHLVLAGRLFGLDEAESERRAEDLLALFDMKQHANRHAVDLSHGTRKKTALGMALLPAPRVLFLDEPFEGLDPLAAVALRDILQRFTRGGGTVFLTSHVLPVVEALCDRVAILAEGRLVMDATRDEIAKGPSLEERFAASVGKSAELGGLPWLP